MYAKIKKDGNKIEVVQFPYSLSDLQRSHSISANLTDDMLDILGIVKVVTTSPPLHDITKETTEQVGCEYNSEKNRWETGYIIRPLTEQERLIKAEEVRTQRNNKLNRCDWTQVLDAPVDRAAWAAYRQALRDITSQSGFPFDVDWPVEP